MASNYPTGRDVLPNDLAYVSPDRCTLCSLTVIVKSVASIPPERDQAQDGQFDVLTKTPGWYLEFLDIKTQ
ncbi:jg15017 [Pararge aegeria aegeria]|uniref:Jg15017 protein n=1 Tax=Pararge aegeria aegeria TaxID=348720 RepID=A0A8S4RC92_9NEOP|nr:jg15017 [Pararge aegeria aegeria]